MKILSILKTSLLAPVLVLALSLCSSDLGHAFQSATTQAKLHLDDELFVRFGSRSFAFTGDHLGRNKQSGDLINLIQAPRVDDPIQASMHPGMMII